MLPLLPAGCSVVRREPGILQIGTLDGLATLVHETPATLAVLRHADGQHDLGLVATVSDLPLESVAESARTLVASKVLVDAEGWSVSARVAPTVPPPEAYALLSTGVDASQVRARLRRRADARVEVVHTSATAALADGLLALLTDAGITARTAPEDHPTLVVVATDIPYPREALDALTAYGIAHLPVLVERDHARIGPLVDPERSPCCRCDDLDRATWDPVWPFVLAQQADPLVAPRSSLALSATQRHALVGLVAEEVVAFCDGDRTDATGGVVRVIGPGGESRRRVALHPACSCQLLAALPGQTPAEASSPSHPRVAG